MVNWIRRKKGMRGYIRKHKGIAIPQGFNPETNSMGDPAKELVRRIKRSVKSFHEHTPTWTQAFNDLIFPLSFRQLVVRVMEAKVGVHEKGYSNTGKWVDIFLAAVYLPGGYAWCAAFAIWAQIRAAIINDIMDNTTRDYEVLRDVFHDLCFGNAAYVPNLQRAFKERRQAHGWKAIPVKWEDVRAGDIIICRNGAHVETATGAVHDGKVPTIGGNTSSGDMANGGEVCRMNRVIGSEATYAGRFVPPPED